MFVGVPELFDVAERGGGEFDPEGLLGGLLENGAKGLEDLVHGDAAESAADEFEAGAAEGGGVEREVGAGAVTDLDVAEAPGFVVESFLDDRGEEGFGGRAPEVVEDDVDFVIGDFVAKGGDEAVAILIEEDGGFGAEGFGFFEGPGVAADGDDAASAEAAGDLHGEVTGAAGGAEDEDVFSGDEMGAMCEGGPGGHGRVDHGGDDGVVEGVGEGGAHGAPGDGALGEGSIGRARGAEEDADAIWRAAYAVDAGDEGKLAGAAVVSSFGERFDDGMEAGSGDGDEDFVGLGDGVGEGFIAWRGIEGMDDCGVHENSPVTMYFNRCETRGCTAIYFSDGLVVA